jgi:uncharacterized alkaline shock family protein YloU
MVSKSIETRFHDEEMKAKLVELEKGGEYLVAGETEIADEVIGTIVATAAREVAGVAEVGTSSIKRMLSETLGGAQKRARGVSLQAGKKEAIVDLTLKIVYGFSVPQLVVNVRKKVGARLLEAVGLIAKEINIRVVGIEFPERMPGELE